MPRQYKRKRLAEEWSLDLPPKKIKKQINSSERWRAKRIIKEQLEEAYPDQDEIRDLRWNMETEHSGICYEKEISSPEHHMSTTLKRLGLVGWNFSLYKCKCENIDKLSDEEIMRRNGYR